MSTAGRQSVTLSCAEYGTPGRPAVILLHGLGQSRTTWADVIPELAGEHHVLAVDLRGHGESPRCAGSYRLDDYVDDVIALLHERGLRPSVLAGHSLGAVIAHAVAQRVPHLVRALILMDAPLYGATRPEDQPRPVIDGYLRTREMLRAQRSREGDAFDGVDPEVYTPVIEDRGVRGPKLDVAVACPVLVLRADGRQGPAFTAADAGRFALVNPAARMIEMAGAGHFIHRDEPDAVASAFHCFLDGIS